MTVARSWRKSSFSGTETDCVELANDLGAVRDTKNPLRVLTVNVRQLVSAARSGRLDR